MTVAEIEDCVCVCGIVPHHAFKHQCNISKMELTLPGV